MKKYKVLWFDDKFEEYENDKDHAFQQGIELVGFGNAKEGLEELKANYNLYDAVIVDGLFYNNAEQGGDPAATAFGEVAKYLGWLKNQEIILPWFIYSGQTSFIKDKSDLIEVLKDKDFADGKVFDKNNINDFALLCNYLVTAANSIGDTIIRNQYRDVFEVCTSNYIGEIAGRDLFLGLKNIDKIDVDQNFNIVRKIVEDLFMAFNKFQLLPSDFVNPNVALNPSSIFLSGREQNERSDSKFKKFILNQENHLPIIISNNLRNILSITQAGSHRSDIDIHVESLKTPYLFKSVLYQLFDVLIWFKNFVDDSPKKNNWSLKKKEAESNGLESLFSTGKVIQLSPIKGFAFFKPDNGSDNVFIPPHLVSEYGLKENMEIKAEQEEYIDNRTQENKTRIKNIKII